MAGSFRQRRALPSVRSLMRETVAERLIRARGRRRAPSPRRRVAERARKPDNRSDGLRRFPGPATMDPRTVTLLLEGARQGDEQALATLIPLIYDELRRLAAGFLRRERPGQTLQPTALVHELYVRLLQDAHLSWQNRAHFFGIAARSMRQILVERARARHAAKRGGGQVRVTFDPELMVAALLRRSISRRSTRH